MRTAPTNWDNIVNTDNYHYEFKLVMDGTEYFPEDVMEMSSTTLAMVSSGMIPAIGGALAGELEVTLKYSGDDSLYNVPRMATLTPYIQVVTDDGTQSSGWLQMSQYMIDTREVDKASGNFKLHAYDAMLKAEQTYFQSVTDASMPLEDVVTEIASLIGVSVNEDTVSHLSAFSYEIPYYAGQYTAREMLQYIGVAVGGNFYINNDNELAVVRVAEFIGSDDLDGGQIASWTTWDSADGGTIDPWNVADRYYGGRIVPWNGGSYNPDTIDIDSRAQSLTTDDEVEPYTQIVLVLDSQQEIVAGTGANIYEANCPFATPDMANLLLVLFERYSFRPFEAEKALLTPLFEFGDSVVIAGETVKPYRYELNYNVLMAANLSADYSREVNHEFIYKPASERKIERVAANTYSQFQVMANEISSKVSQTDYNGNKIASLINQTATTVQIQAQHINLNGVVTANENFSIDTDGTFHALEGWIGENLQVVNGKLIASYTFPHTYTEADKTRVRNIIMGSITPTQEDYDIYDLTRDGEISTMDYITITNCINNTDGIYTAYLSINPYEAVNFGFRAYSNVSTSGGTSITPLGVKGSNCTFSTINADTARIGGGTMPSGYVLWLNGSGYASGSFVSASKEELKTDIRQVDFDVFDAINNTDIYEFKYKADLENGMNNVTYGAIIGDAYKCDSHIMTANKDAVSTYSMTSILWIAVKQLKEELDALKEAQ